MDNKVYAMTFEVIEAINDELAYIGTLNKQNRSDGIHHGTEGQLLTLKAYTDKAIAAWVSNPSSDQALHELRKCAAIAIRALLTESCPKRAFTKEPITRGGGSVSGQSEVLGSRRGIDSVASSLPAK